VWWHAPAPATWLTGGAARSVDRSNQRQEMTMSKQDNTAQGSAAPVATPKFKDMGFMQKVAYSCKAIACILTFGFAYPNIFSD
jgi:hypothetical protein